MVGHRLQMVDGRHMLVLLARLHHLLHGVHARLGGVFYGGFKRAPEFLLVGGQPKSGLHAGELSVEQRLAVGRPVLHALHHGWPGLLIALRGGSGQRKG